MSLSVAIHDADDLVTPVVSLGDTHDRAVRVQLNESGSASFAVPADHSDLASIQFGRVAMFDDSVSSQRFGMLIESHRRALLKEGEGGAQTVTVSGRLLPALLEHAVVFPEGGATEGEFSDVRVFNWANPAFDDSAWTAGEELAQQGTNPNATSQYAPPYADELLPAEWADPDAYWMGPGPGDWEDSPDGWWFLRWKFNIPNAGAYILDFAVDNDCYLYVDGVEIGARGFDYFKTYTKELDLSSGDHVIAARIVNAVKVGNNPSAFIGSLFVNDDGERGSVVRRTTGAVDIDVLVTPTVEATAGTRFVIPVPGMTAGEVLDLLLYEAQARGALTDWTWDFTAANDSDSTAWPVVAEIALKVGDDYLTVLRQLAEAYVDFAADYDATVLHAYVKDGLGSASGVSFTEGTSVSDLEVDGEG